MLWLFQELVPCVVIPQVTHCAFLSQVRKSQYVSCLVTNKIINPCLRTILLVTEKKYYVEVQRRTVVYVCIRIYIYAHIYKHICECVYMCVFPLQTHTVYYIYITNMDSEIYICIYMIHTCIARIIREKEAINLTVL